MAYIGKDPAEAYQSFVKQDFSVSATTSYTLSQAVNNQNEIALFINHVRQEPTTAYTASGTSLTLTSATASGDDMYCIYLGMAKQTVNAPDGSVGSSQVASTIITGQTAETSIATDDTVLIHDTSAGALRKMTRANFVSGVGGVNTPAVMAYSNSNQTISNNTLTKVEFDAEEFDTDNAFDKDTNYRFTVPSGKAGKYYIHASLYLYGNNNDERLKAFDIYKNGASVRRTEHFSQNSTGRSSGGNTSNSAVLDLAESDYIEIYGKLDAASGTPAIYGATASNSRYTVLHIFKLVE